MANFDPAAAARACMDDIVLWVPSLKAQARITEIVTALAARAYRQGYEDGKEAANADTVSRRP